MSPAALVSLYLGMQAAKASPPRHGRHPFAWHFTDSKHEEVPAVLTPSTFEEWVTDLRSVLQEGLNVPHIPTNVLVIFAAHSATETQEWTRMYNWNPGNFRTSNYAFFIHPADGQPYQSLPDITEGIAAFAATLVYGYRGACVAAERGDIHGYVRALKAGGYFTAPEKRYEEALRAYALAFQKRIQALS